MNKIEIVTSVGFSFHNIGKLESQTVRRRMDER
jgi:hypothetical protein